ncbi:hypothetical protein ACQPZP_15625 [Spirillospora sp. CA-142024]|uniref:hypothetical protein n=1 Tax=Spirillospora sp. CA-142024 TaxID=3240036 RepID=UPI003D8E102A
MAGERRGGSAVHAEAPPEGDATTGTRAAGPEPSGTDPADSDPLHTVRSRSAAFDPVPRPGPAETRALIRVQLRIALGTGALVLTVMAGLPALLVLVPEIARARVHGVPPAWLVLAFGVQPVWIAASLRQLRRAERAERDFAGRAGRR